MICPRCGGEASAALSRCPQCSAPLASNVITGVLTPPVPLAGDEAPTLAGINRAPTTPPIDPPHTNRSVTPASDDPHDAGTVVATPRIIPGVLNVGQMFGSRYHIIRALGVGGMGAVYQAWDAELGITVAIKVIRPDVMADPVTAAEVERRFKRELLLARQVTHKNVVRIHDLGEIEGIKYITMSYVDGSDLSTIMMREGRLPVATVLRIARQVVAGLVEAHKAGVVHRDLKPPNIMIDKDGNAVIMDFGIARSAGQRKVAPAPEVAGLPTGVRQTAVTADATHYGVIVGTLAYMAPEQAKGLDVDQRADIYAMGLILFDMLAGRDWRAQHAENSIAELNARIVQPPPPVKTLRTEVPEPVAQLVSRCIEPDPSKRYQTTEQLAAELERFDENGLPIRVKRVVGLRLAAAVAVVLVAVAIGAWWYARTLTPAAPPAPHDPVSVVIADFQNNTGDPTFDRTLEPMLKRALEGAGFISAFDRNAITRTFGTRPPETLDDAAARALAVKEGLGVVMGGSIDRQGSGYAVSVKATQTVTGKVVANATERASNKDQVLAAAAGLAAEVRTGLGDQPSESSKLFAMTSLSTTSFDVVREYAAAQEASSNNKFDEAIQHAAKSVALDPKFGVGYQVLAFSSRNVGKVQDAEKYIREALKYLDGMTERERFSTRGFFYRITLDYPQCVKEYGELISRYAADVVGHNQRALCLSQLRDLRGAASEMQQVVAMLPNRVLFRDNLALYSNYASDFETAEREVRAIAETVRASDAYAGLALALAQSGQGRTREAAETYTQLSSVNNLGSSMSDSGLGDLAAYEGRFSDAARILEAGAAADVAANNADRAAAKWAAIASARMAQKQKVPAVAAADKALSLSKAVKIRFLAARVFVEAGESAKAAPLIKGLSSELQAEPQAYAKILEGETALAAGDSRQAIKVMLEANTLLDTWIGHYDLGRAYLDATQFAQADSEFDRCLKRRGEALALFLDEEPTYAFFPTVYYYQGRVREGLQNAGAVDAYRKYIDVRGQSKEDPLLPDVRRRAGL
jgi:tetratricopeptide (TPR) repeat protein/tRNA A-37 threonylcarbamoyl transferase component Bud32